MSTEGDKIHSRSHQRMPSRSRITMAMVAQELGVSLGTVSNAYNHPSLLKPALRERVLQTARKLGYPGPDPVAATLSRGRVGSLAWVFDDPFLTY